MKQAIAVVSAVFFGFAAQAQDTSPPPQTEEPPALFFDGSSAHLNEFLWKNRVIVVFADSPLDPRFTRQVDLLERGRDDLLERDIVVLTDTTPADSELRETLRPRGFMFVLIAKDGTVYLRKPFPWDVREISRSIDKLPTRQQEIRDRRESARQAEQVDG